MSAFCGTKLLQFLQNLEAQMSVYVCVYIYFFFYSNLMYNIPIQMLTTCSFKVMVCFVVMGAHGEKSKSSFRAVDFRDDVGQVG